MWNLHTTGKWSSHSSILTWFYIWLILGEQLVWQQADTIQEEHLQGAGGGQHVRSQGSRRGRAVLGLPCIGLERLRGLPVAGTWADSERIKDTRLTQTSSCYHWWLVTKNALCHATALKMCYFFQDSRPVKMFPVFVCMWLCNVNVTLLHARYVFVWYICAY